MVSNELSYRNSTPAKPLKKSTLNKMVWLSTMLQASFNYERMQAGGWLWSMLPGLQEIHTDKEDLKLSMKHNLEFFNTHPFLVTFVMGIVLSLEQQKADVNTIRAVRVAAMGPLGGIGDALFWFTLIPITAGITAKMAIDGNIIGPILYFLIAFGVQMGLRYGLMYWSYNLGTKAISVLTKNAKEFTHAASMLGVFVVGALTCNYGATSLGILIPNGQVEVEKTRLVLKGTEIITEKFNETQANFIDLNGLLGGVLPALIPLCLTLLCYFLIKKKGWKPIHCIGLLLVIGIVGGAIGIWPASGEDYKPFINVPWSHVFK